MKNITTTIFLVFALFQIAFSQANKGFNYQTILRDQTRQLIVNQPVSFRMSILEDDANGFEAYSETHSDTTDEFGRVSLVIGMGDAVSGEFDSLDWEGISYYLQVEIDPKGGSDFLEMGAAPLLAVPVADHARTATWELSDSDRDPQNEIQQLIKNGNIIELSNGGLSVTLLDDDAMNELQKISKIGNIISLDHNGGEVVLNDDDPANEVQQLTKTGNEVSLSLNGGSFTLNDDDPNNEIQDLTLGLSGTTLVIGNWASSVGLSSFMDSPWTKYSSSRIYYPYQVAIGTSAFSSGANLTVERNLDVVNTSGKTIIKHAEINGGGGYFATYGTSTAENFIVTSPLGVSNNYGYAAVFGPLGGSGTSQSQQQAAGMLVKPTSGSVDKGGILFAYGSNGGQKNFVMPHPNQPGKHIWYACIEGPEAAAYERGTIQLTNGEAFAPFSETFEIVVNPETMTVILTPLDASSKGLAVIEKTQKGFKVKELSNGTGNYKIDWEAKGVRKGHEDYRVVRDASEIMPAMPDRSDK